MGRQTVIRCHQCGHAKEWIGRYRTTREPTEICFCLPWEHEREFVEVTNARQLAAPGLNLVQRE